MQDFWHTLCKFVDYNRNFVMALLMAAILSIALVGCQPKTTSILDPSRQVTPQQLDNEIIALQADMNKRADAIVAMEKAFNTDVASKNDMIESAKLDLEEQIAMRQKLLEVAGGLVTSAASGGVTAPAAIASILQLVTLFSTGGLLLDNRRKDRILKGDTRIPAATT